MRWLGKGIASAHGMHVNGAVLVHAAAAVMGGLVVVDAVRATVDARARTLAGDPVRSCANAAALV